MGPSTFQSAVALLIILLQVAIVSECRDIYLPSFISKTGISRPQKKGAKGSNHLPSVLGTIQCGATYTRAVDAPCMGVGHHRLRACPGNPAPLTTWANSQPGAGGPTGCKEAWATVLADDRFLPGVLVLIHTLRKFSLVPRDIVVIVSATVSAAVVDKVRETCVLVRRVDPFVSDRAKSLMAKSERYASGYWVVKMFVWRAEEYSKVVYLDADVYVRQNADALFCMETDKEHPVAVTPRSSQDAAAGFNAGMFSFRPNKAIFDELLGKFTAMSDAQVLATTEQDFLNAVFKKRYLLVPIDFVMKHRRVVREEGLWDLKRVNAYHMNGSPKPWNPQWLVPCAYPPPHTKDAPKYMVFFKEWWQFYYDMIGMQPPTAMAEYKIQHLHDPTNSWVDFQEDAWKAKNCNGKAAKGGT